MKNSKKKAWNDSEVSQILVNPFYAVTLSGDLFGEHQPLVTEDQWVTANVQLIDQLGAEVYLRQLLAVLKGDFPRQPDES